MTSNNIKKLITHNGSFHADDIFACATLSILLKGKINIIRTRDPEVIKEGDYVFDVGGIYDPINNRFDHHQKGGAGAHANGIDYASFGLVWEKFGLELCGNQEGKDEIERKIVSPIDATDNGTDIVTSKFENIFPYNADQIFLSYFPTWKETEKNVDEIFVEQVEKAVEILKREIKVVQDDVEGKHIILDSYRKAVDKRIIELDIAFPRYLLQKTLSKLPEPTYMVYPSGFGKNWKIEAVAVSPSTLESRKLFPESWRGFLNNDPKFKEVTGVPEALFSHRSGFYMTASSKEGAVKLAELAIKS